MSALPWYLAGGAAGLWVLSRRARPARLLPLFLSPFPGAVATSGWGRPRDRDRDGVPEGIHRGIDLPGPRGTPLEAPVDAVIERVVTTDDSTAGRFVQFLVDTTAGPIRIRYLHMDGVDVRPGSVVAAGAVVGTLGSTGTSSTGPHVHVDTHVSPAIAAAYVARYGQPQPGLPLARAGLGIAIPSEPLFAVGLSARTRSEASARRVPRTL